MKVLLAFAITGLLLGGCMTTSSPHVSPLQSKARISCDSGQYKVCESFDGRYSRAQCVCAERVSYVLR